MFSMSILVYNSCVERKNPKYDIAVFVTCNIMRGID